MKIEKILEKTKNFLFLGEAGSGKSEVALNFAKYISKNLPTYKTVHFFDMDMTKPLFRSRDIADNLEKRDIVFHYQEQFMDAPTLVGGVRRYLLDPDSIVIMDVGGNEIGARSIGGFAALIRNENTQVYYVINPYRPWSDTIEHIDGILGAILGVSHIEINKLKIISNPNIGKETKIQNVIDGHAKLKEMIEKYLPIDFLCINENIYKEFEAYRDIFTLSIKRYLKYPWEN